MNSQNTLYNILFFMLISLSSLFAQEPPVGLRLNHDKLGDVGGIDFSNGAKMLGIMNDSNLQLFSPLNGDISLTALRLLLNVDTIVLPSHLQNLRCLGTDMDGKLVAGICGDNLGNHKAEINLNMDNNNIIFANGSSFGPNLLGGIDFDSPGSIDIHGVGLTLRGVSFTTINAEDININANPGNINLSTQLGSNIQLVSQGNIDLDAVGDINIEGLENINLLDANQIEINNRNLGNDIIVNAGRNVLTSAKNDFNLNANKKINLLAGDEINIDNENGFKGITIKSGRDFTTEARAISLIGTDGILIDNTDASLTSSSRDISLISDFNIILEPNQSGAPFGFVRIPYLADSECIAADEMGNLIRGECPTGVGGADNLGTHIATMNLDMKNNNIINLNRLNFDNGSFLSSVGNLTLQSVNGATIKANAGQLNLEGNNGVDINALAGNITAQSANDIDINANGGQLNLKGSTGIDINATAGNINLKSANNMDLKANGGKLTMDASNGIDIKAGSGNEVTFFNDVNMGDKNIKKIHSLEFNDNALIQESSEGLEINAGTGKEIKILNNIDLDANKIENITKLEFPNGPFIEDLLGTLMIEGVNGVQIDALGKVFIDSDDEINIRNNGFGSQDISIMAGKNFNVTAPQSIILDAANPGFVRIPYLAGSECIGADALGNLIPSECDNEGGSSHQTLVLVETALSITEGNTIDLSVLQDGIEDADADPTNELQNLSLDGTALGIANGNTIDLSVLQDGTEDADADPSNELQSLSLDGTILGLSEGNIVDLSTLYDLNYGSLLRVGRIEFCPPQNPNKRGRFDVVLEDDEANFGLRLSSNNTLGNVTFTHYGMGIRTTGEEPYPTTLFHDGGFTVCSGNSCIGSINHNFNEENPIFFINSNIEQFGNLHVFGNSSATTKTFKIDHPQDPKNKYLFHSVVESPDMMNIYNGNIVTNESGEAIVELPQYFEALNMNFRYQLTVIGDFAQAIISEKIQNNQFTIRTNKPNIEVSWQVTGVRNDAYAQDNRVQVEVEKPNDEKGTLLYDPTNPHTSSTKHQFHLEKIKNR